MDWVEERIRRGELTAVGHRVVHGGPKYSEPQRITPQMVEELHQLEPFDPTTAGRDPADRGISSPLSGPGSSRMFRYSLSPRPAPCSPAIADPAPLCGKRRAPVWVSWLSYAFLVEELARLAGPQAARGRLILAHLGTVPAWRRSMRANPWIPAWASPPPEACR